MRNKLRLPERLLPLVGKRSQSEVLLDLQRVFEEILDNGRHRKTSCFRKGPHISISTRIQNDIYAGSFRRHAHFLCLFHNVTQLAHHTKDREDVNRHMGGEFSMSES